MLNHDLVLKSDDLYLAGDSNADGSGKRATGLYVRDTRHLDRFDVRLNGVILEALSARVLKPATRSSSAATARSPPAPMPGWKNLSVR